MAGSGAGDRRQIVILFDSGSIPLGHLVRRDHFQLTSVLLGEPSASKTDSMGFESSHLCSTRDDRGTPTWLDSERRLSCKQDYAGANPVVGSLKLMKCSASPRSVRDSTRLCEGRRSGSNRGEDTFHHCRTTALSRFAVQVAVSGAGSS